MTLSNMPPGCPSMLPGDWDKDISYTAGVIIHDTFYTTKQFDRIDDCKNACIKNTLNKIESKYCSVKFNSEFKVIETKIIGDELQISYEFLAEVEGDTTVDLQYGDDQVERDIIMDIVATLSEYGLDDITIIDNDIDIDYH